MAANYGCNYLYMPESQINCAGKIGNHCLLLNSSPVPACLVWRQIAYISAFDLSFCCEKRDGCIIDVMSYSPPCLIKAIWRCRKRFCQWKYDFRLIVAPPLVTRLYRAKLTIPRTTATYKWYQYGILKYEICFVNNIPWYSGHVTPGLCKLIEAEGLI